jgi:NADPH2:quinone reductase
VSDHRLWRLHGGDLHLERAPTPTPPSDEVEVRVRAFGINRADLLQRAGRYPAPPGAPPDILGLEFSGEITRDAHGWRAGDRVAGLCAGGGYSEHICAHPRALIPLPARWSWAQGAALAEAYLTAYDALDAVAELRAGERALIHAIGSGVGVAAAGVAAWMGAEVVGTTRSAWKRDRALSELPVRAVHIVEGGDLSAVVEAEPRGFDVIIDLVGGDYLAGDLRLLAPRGRVVVVGLLAGATAQLPLGPLLAKRASVHGTVLRSRPLEERVALTQRFNARLLPALSAGALAPPSVEALSALSVERAHERLASGEVWSQLACVWD